MSFVVEAVVPKRKGIFSKCSDENRQAAKPHATWISAHIDDWRSLWRTKSRG